MSSYIINKTDGSVLTEVNDGTINQTATDLTLIGKNSSSYGEFLNENFVKLLENFANTSKPNYPIVGQLWYDTAEARLKVYDGNGWKVSGGTIVASEIPGTISQGDIWIDSTRQQLYFNDGTTTLLAGPAYTKAQGVSGIQVVDIIDTNQISHTVLLLYIAGTPVGVFSRDQFVPADNSLIPNFSGTVNIGFTAGNTSGFKFNVPVTQADTLLAADNSLKTADSFLSTTDNSSTVGSIAIFNSTPLVLGLNQDIQINVEDNSLKFVSNIANQNVKFDLINQDGLLTALFLDSQNERVGVYTTDPQAMLDVAGDVNIQGSLTVLGNVTTVNTTNLEVKDSLIDLGATDTPTDVTAEGGGIRLFGDTDKTFTWSATETAWNSSENVNLASGNTYKINNFDVLSQTQLGTTVTSAPGLNSIGTLNSLQVSYLGFNNNVISYVNPSLGNGDVVLTPKGSGSVSVSNKKITNLADPTSNTDAVNLQTVNLIAQTAPLAVSINVGSWNNSQIVSIVLNKIYPVGEHQDGAVCRVWCIDTAVGKQFILTGGAWSWQYDL
jgi:hypothetical protein